MRIRNERIRKITELLKSNLWLIPSGIVIASALSALALLAFDRKSSELLAENRWSWIFGAGPDGAREMLSTISGSVVTVAGVAFSITIVVLSLASSQYSPRVLRNFISDWKSQSLLGGFLGIFVYCIFVLRTIRSSDQDPFVPRFAIFGSVALAFVAIILLIYFIHHIANSIRASSIIRSVFLDTRSTIDDLFCDEFETDDPEPVPACDHEIPCWQTGFIQRVQAQDLARVAHKHDLIFVCERQVGDFVSRGEPLLKVSGAVSHDVLKDARKYIEIGATRTMEQDAKYGIRQLVDVALKGLSPGINDTTTAMIAIDHLGALIADLCEKQTLFRPCGVEGRIRMYPQGHSFRDFVELSYGEIRMCARSNVTVLNQLLNSLRRAAVRVNDPSRTQALLEQVTLVQKTAATFVPHYDRKTLESRARELSALLSRKSKIEELENEGLSLSVREDRRAFRRSRMRKRAFEHP